MITPTKERDTLLGLVAHRWRELRHVSIGAARRNDGSHGMTIYHGTRPLCAEVWDTPRQAGDMLPYIVARELLAVVDKFNAEQEALADPVFGPEHVHCRCTVEPLADGEAPQEIDDDLTAMLARAYRSILVTHGLLDEAGVGDRHKSAPERLLVLIRRHDAAMQGRARAIEHRQEAERQQLAAEHRSGRLAAQLVDARDTLARTRHGLEKQAAELARARREVEELRRERDHVEGLLVAAAALQGIVPEGEESAEAFLERIERELLGRTSVEDGAVNDRHDRAHEARRRTDREAVEFVARKTRPGRTLMERALRDNTLDDELTAMLARAYPTLEIQNS